MPNELGTVKVYKLVEIEEAFGISRRVLAEHCKAGTLPARKAGSWFVEETGLRMFFNPQIILDPETLEIIPHLRPKQKENHAD